MLRTEEVNRSGTFLATASDQECTVNKGGNPPLAPATGRSEAQSGGTVVRVFDHLTEG